MRSKPTSAELVAGQIVMTDNDDTDGVRVGAISVAAPAPPASLAKPSAVRGDAALGTYKSGVLVAGDNAGGSPTRVYYAPAGDNVNATWSYRALQRSLVSSLLECRATPC